MTDHLSEACLEALAAGRLDLVSEAERAHLDGCLLCQARLAATKAELQDATVGLRRLPTDGDELDAMVTAALRLHRPQPAAIAPSHLWWGGTIGVAVALLASLMTVHRVPGALAEMNRFGWRALGMLEAADYVVGQAIPGGWAGVSVLCLLGLGATMIPLRALGARQAIASSSAVLAMALVTGAASPALAYRVEGPWPEPAPLVTLDVEDATRTEALQAAARQAGVSLIADLPEAEGERPLTLHIERQPLPVVIEAILADRPVVVRPNGPLIRIAPDAAPVAEPTPATPPTPPTPPVAMTPVVPDSPSPVNDRFTFGNDLEVGADETVKGVFTFGGDVEVRGRVLGDVATFGGDVVVSGYVVGNVFSAGGDVEILPGARVDGDVHTFGGELDVDDEARVYGAQGSTQGAEDVIEAIDAEEEATSFWERFADNLSSSAFVFLAGLLLLGVARRHFGTIAEDLGDAPVSRVLYGLLSLIGTIFGMAAVAITIIGIPVAALIGLGLFLTWFVATAAGAWWLGSKTPWGGDSPVRQLGVGCALLFAVGFVPAAGELVWFGMFLAGLGAIAMTRYGRRRAGEVPAPTTGPFR